MELSTLLYIFATLIIPIWIYINTNPKRQKFVEAINKIPGPFAIPILGNAYDVFRLTRENFFEMMNKETMKHWPIFRTWNGPIAEVHLSDPDHIETILRSSVNIDKGIMYSFLHPWLGMGLLTSSGQKWHTRRKLITPTFHFKILENFQEVFAEKSRTLVQKLEKEVGNAGGFNVCPYITLCTLDIICETAMGTEVNAQDDSHSPYVSAVNAASELTFARLLRPWFHNDFIYSLTKDGRKYNECLNVLHSFTAKVIGERKMINMMKDMTGQEEEVDVLGKKRRVAFLDLMLEALDDDGAELSNEAIREEVDTFMFEGHDTTSASLCWTLFLLGNNPEVQERVFEEQAEIFQDSDRLPTMQDIGEMKYLERVLKESLRLYPSVPFIARTLKEDVQAGEYTLPTGCQVTVHVYHANRNPKCFPNPDQFNPDNFLPENVQGRHPFAYIPFSAGSRNCIGQKFALQEEKTVLSSIVRHFRFRATDRPEDVHLTAELVLRPSNGIRLALERRSTQPENY